jgi:hypothetical protein
MIAAAAVQNMRQFTLEPFADGVHGAASRAALRRYASSIELSDPKGAAAVLDMVARAEHDVRSPKGSL